jgi:hypothetical protein
MIGGPHAALRKPRRSSTLRSHEGGRRGGEAGSVWARAARPSPQAQERTASVQAARSARREAIVLAAIDKLQAKLEPVAARQGMEWDDVLPILMRVDTRTLEAANENPENLLLLLSQRMQSRRRSLSLDGIGEDGEIGSPRSDLQRAQLREASGERVSPTVSPMHRASLKPKPPPTRVDKVTRALHVLYLGFNSIIAQFVLYVVYILFFQALIAAVRTKEEVYLTKYLVDNIIEEPISEDYDNDQFMSIANLGDIDLFVSGVLLPALVVDTRMDESFKTPFEMAETFDNLDWSAGLMIKQVRVAEHDQGTCGTVETGAVMRWFAESQVSKQSERTTPCWP